MTKMTKTTMTKTSTRIAVSLVAMLIAAMTIQTASAAERNAKHRYTPTMNEQVRNANASAAPVYTGQSFRGDEAMSAPAGR